MHEYLNRRYALAIYEVAEGKGKVESYLSQLRELVSVINSNEEFLLVIKHPQISTSKKKEIFTNTFKDAIDKDLIAFLLLLVEKHRILFLSGILEEIEKIHLDRSNTLLANIKTVVPLKIDEKANLISKLEGMYKMTIILNEEIDSSIIGGVYVRVGNDVIDGTIKSKFEEMRKLMLNRE
jgi:F-type H+-transporting ATPase subunit delta